MRLKFAAFALLPVALGATASQPLAPVCGTGDNASICLASVDVKRKVKPELRPRLADAGTRAIDIINSPAFEAELKAFHARYDANARDTEHARHWRDFDPTKAIAQTRASFDGLHVVTIGGLRALFSATFAGNLAYEGYKARWHPRSPAEPEPLGPPCSGPCSHLRARGST